MIKVYRSIAIIPEILNSQEMEIAKMRLKEFYFRSEISRSQERYSVPFEPQLIKEIDVSLRQLFKNKCAYCETPIPPNSMTGSIENFRPKSNARGLKKDFSREHYWWLTYEWGNLYLSCETCKRYKSSWFPVEGKRAEILTPINEIHGKEFALLIDPCFDNPEEHLVFDENGKIDFLTPKGRTTIGILKLNRVELVSARLEASDLLFRQCKLMSTMWERKKKERNRIKEIALIWKDLFSYHSTQPYLAIRRQLLSKWLRSRGDIQKYIDNQEYGLSIEQFKSEGIEEVKVIEEIKRFDKEILSGIQKENIEEALNFENLKHVYIEKIELKNFKCFKDLTINFSHEILDGIENKKTDSEPWLLFLGENGVGKSSILKAITIALCGEDYFAKLKLNSSNLLQKGKQQGFIKLFLKGEENPVEVKFDGKTIKSNINKPKANLIGYGSVRLLPKERKFIAEKNGLTGVKAQNLFDYSVALTDADRWLIDRTEDDFNRASLALKDLMLLDPEVLIRRDVKKEKVYIQFGDSQINIDELSDGYQSVYALAVDIMASFVHEKITYEIAEGVILIDEIGTHLHPRWKMEVVSQFRRAFPRMQFIVTTHEPLCLRGLKQGEVSVLTKDWDKNIYAITDLPDPATLRVDQILTSPFFGLHSAVDPDTEKIFNEYYSLLAKDKLTIEEENRKLDLSDKIPKMKYLGDTLREELAIYVIDELLAKKKDSFKLSELKKEAKERVTSIWETLDTDKT